MLPTGRNSTFGRGFYFFTIAVGIIYISTTANSFAIRVNAIPAVGIGYSDNIDRLPDSEKEGARAYTGQLAIRLQEDSPTLEIDADSLLEYWNYSGGSTPEENRVFLNGSLTWRIRPETFHWFISDNLRQTLIDPLESDTPENRENTNAFLTGPDLQLRLGRAAKLQVAARYTRLDFAESSDANNDQQSVFTRLVYDKSSSKIFSITAGFTRTDFKENIEADFNRQDAFVSFKDVRGRSELTFDLGGTNIDRSETENIKGPLGRIRYQYETLQNQRLEASFVGQYTDFGQDFISRSADREQIIVNASSNQISSDIYFVKRGELSFETSWPRTIAGINGIWSDEDYQEQIELDRTLFSILGNVTYLFSPRLNGSFLGGYTHTDYSSIERDDNDYTIQAQLLYRLSRNLSAAISIRRDDRNSTDSNSSYEENSMLLIFRYDRSGL